MASVTPSRNSGEESPAEAPWSLRRRGIPRTARDDTYADCDRRSARTPLARNCRGDMPKRWRNCWRK